MGTDKNTKKSVKKVSNGGKPKGDPKLMMAFLTKPKGKK